MALTVLSAVLLSDKLEARFSVLLSHSRRTG